MAWDQQAFVADKCFEMDQGGPPAVAASMHEQDSHDQCHREHAQHNSNDDR